MTSPTHPRNRPRVVVIGAAGQMLQVTVRSLARHGPQAGLHLIDMNPVALEALAGELRQQGFETTTAVLDITQVDRLQQQIQDAALVIHGAGPFYRTAGAVRQACLAAGVDYLDIDDDVESNREAIALHDEACRRGTRLLVGCGASPGLTNLLALDAMAALDTVHSLEMAWCVGDEGPQQMGRAVAAHTFHIGAGDSVTVRQGRPVTHESMSRSTRFPMGGDIGELLLYETAHPEPVQFFHSHAHLQEVVCWGGFDPAPINGLVKGVSQALKHGRLNDDEAFAFLHDVAAGRSGTLKGWRWALSGVWRQWKRAEVRPPELLRLVTQSVRGQAGPCRNGLAARATGWRQGQRVEVLRQTVRSPASPVTPSMATGTATAAFAILALSAPRTQLGTLFPQMWAPPAALFQQLNALGLPDQVSGSERLLHELQQAA